MERGERDKGRTEAFAVTKTILYGIIMLGAYHFTTISPAGCTSPCSERYCKEGILKMEPGSAMATVS